MENPRTNMGEKIITPRRLVMAGAMFLLAASALALFTTGSQAGWGKANATNATGVSHGRVSADIEPRAIAVGEAAILVVQVSGEETGPPALSPVDGLRFIPWVEAVSINPLTDVSPPPQATCFRSKRNAQGIL